MRIPDEHVKRWVKLYDGTKNENRFINEQQRLESLAAILDIIMGYLKDDFPGEAIQERINSYIPSSCVMVTIDGINFGAFGEDAPIIVSKGGKGTIKTSVGRAVEYIADAIDKEGDSCDLDEAVQGIVDLVRYFERAGMTYQEAESFVTSLIAKGA